MGEKYNIGKFFSLFVIFVIESGEIVIFVIRQQDCCGTGSLLSSGLIFP